MKITLNELRNLIKSVIREETSKKKSDKQYNKEVDAYKFFVYNLDNEKVESGYEYQGDAKDAASDYDNAKVVTINQLKKMDIDVDALKTKWKNM
jgi:hypothetical protein